MSILNFLVLSDTLYLFILIIRVDIDKWIQLAPRCRHFMSEWDSHKYFPSCTDKGKCDDICDKEKPEDSCICLQFSSDQIKKWKARKVKEEAISKELELHSPISGWLVTPHSITANLLGLVKAAGGTCTGTRLGDKLPKIRDYPNTALGLSWLHIQSKQGQIFPHRTKVGYFDKL